MSLRILIAPDKFKGSLGAVEAAEAIASGIKRVFPDAQLDLCPIADGGEGFMETIAGAKASRWVEMESMDALGRSISSRYLLTDDDSTAVIEMAETAGMWRLSEDKRVPLRATTRGVGLQMRHAVEAHGVQRIVVGLGGSATNDGGCGMAAALGIRFLSETGEAFDPLPGDLQELVTVDRSSRIALPPVIVACDVDNPLLGLRGATAVFSPQKGAGPGEQAWLEAGLARLVEVAGARNDALTKGAGAAGGLGFGLIHFADAKLVQGFDLVADLLQLDARIGASDRVVTGEGSLDVQSLGGKGPVALARRARAIGTPVTAFCGSADRSLREAAIFDQILALDESGLPLETLMREAAGLVTELAASAAREWKA